MAKSPKIPKKKSSKSRKKRTPPSNELLSYVSQFSQEIFEAHSAHKNDFIDYCRGEFGLSEEEYLLELRDANVPEPKAQEILQQIKLRLQKERKSEKALGNFGEAVSSWFLNRQKGHWVFRYSWNKRPFDTETGIDVCAVDIHQKHLSFVESKAGQDKRAATSQLKNLFNQLHAYEQSDTFKTGPNEYAAIMKRLTELIRDGKIPDTVSKELLDEIDKDIFKRIGFLITPEAIQYGSLSIKVPPPESTEGTSSNHEFHQTVISELNDWFDNWLEKARVAESAGKFS